MRTLLQHANGLPFENYVRCTSTWHSDYAALHHAAYLTSFKGYDHAPFSANSQSAFCLMDWMRRMADNSIIVQMDGDALVVQLNVWLGDALKDRAEDIALVGKDWFVNSGVTVVRNTPRAREFYAEVCRRGPGSNVNDQMDVQIHKLACERGWKDAVLRLGDKWNWYPSYGAQPRELDCPESDAIVRAWHGVPRNSVVECMKARLATLTRKAA